MFQFTEAKKEQLQYHHSKTWHFPTLRYGTCSLFRE